MGKGGEETTTLCAMFELLCPVTQSDLSHLSWLCHSVCLFDKKHDFGKRQINQVQFSFFLVVCVCVPFLSLWSLGLCFDSHEQKNVLKWVSALISHASDNWLAYLSARQWKNFSVAILMDTVYNVSNVQLYMTASAALTVYSLLDHILRLLKWCHAVV